MANNNNIFPLNLSKKTIIIIAPIPYIGQKGPFRNPVFIIFFSHILLNIDSNTHPTDRVYYKVC